MLASYIEDLKKSIKKTEKEILRIEEDFGLDRIIKSDIKSKFAKKKKYEKAVETAKIALEKLNDLLEEYDNVFLSLSIEETEDNDKQKQLKKIETKFMYIFNNAKKNLL